jgi:uncharacterized protein YecT (DUF1311 family)
MLDQHVGKSCDRQVAIATTLSSRHLRSLLALVVVLTPAQLLQAQEEKAPTLAEAKAEFAKADRELNQAWSAAKAAVSGRELAVLTQSQRDWLDFRDGRAREESDRSGDKGRGAIWHTTAADLTQSRAEWLRGRAATAKKPLETLTGLWIDSYGGTMQLVQQDKRLLFLIDVVRGATYHTGGVTGVASWNERVGWWSDKGVDPEKTDESNLAFVDRDGCVEVIGANTGHYHGARAYFDGVYAKVGGLDAKTEAELIKAAESGELPESAEDEGE